MKKNMKSLINLAISCTCLAAIVGVISTPSKAESPEYERGSHSETVAYLSDILAGSETNNVFYSSPHYSKLTFGVSLDAFVVDDVSLADLACQCDMEGLEDRITALEDVDVVTQSDLEEMIIDMHGYVDDGDSSVQDNLDALETHIFDYIDEKIGEIPVCECDLTSISNDLEDLRNNMCTCDSAAISGRLDSIEGTLSGWDSVTNQVEDNKVRIGAEVRVLEQTIQALQNQVHALEDAMYYVTNNTSSAVAPFGKK